MLYILDEPSIGLHQRDNRRLIDTLLHLRDLGNTVIVVEHDEETMRSADHLVDMGPGAGEHGGWVVAQGPPSFIAAEPASLTGQYLSGKRRIEVPGQRRLPVQWLTVRDASMHNLKHIDVAFPVGAFTVVAGVSGSGKSTLVNEILYKGTAARVMRGSRARPGAHGGIDGLELLDKVIDIDQSPIGRTPRSNPATYTGVFDHIRQLFAATPESKVRGYKPGRFSFNVKGGRCEVCKGDGQIKIEMHFLPDVYVPCEACKGQRYNRDTLEVYFKGKNIAEVLDMSVDEGCTFFANLPRIARRLTTLNDVGLGYIKLGQPATTLSGGEAQRVKLADRALQGRHRTHPLHPRRAHDGPAFRRHRAPPRRPPAPGRPGQHGGRDRAQPRRHQVGRLGRRPGPRGRRRGGEVIVEGTPEDLLEAADRSYTGEYLRHVLGSDRQAPVAAARKGRGGGRQPSSTRRGRPPPRRPKTAGL